MNKLRLKWCSKLYHKQSFVIHTDIPFLLRNIVHFYSNYQLYIVNAVHLLVILGLVLCFKKRVIQFTPCQPTVVQVDKSTQSEEVLEEPIITEKEMLRSTGEEPSAFSLMMLTRMSKVCSMTISTEEKYALEIHLGLYPRMLQEWLDRAEVDNEVLKVREEKGHHSV